MTIFDLAVQQARDDVARGIHISVASAKAAADYCTVSGSIIEWTNEIYFILTAR